MNANTYGKKMNRLLHPAFRICAAVLIILSSFAGYTQPYPLQVNTIVTQPVSPYLPEILANAAGYQNNPLAGDISRNLRITLRNSSGQPVRVRLVASIVRLAPEPLMVALRPDFRPELPVVVNPNQLLPLNQDLIDQAFGNFDEDDLIFENVDMNYFRENGLNYKLPEGTYQVCVAAYDFDAPGTSVPLNTPGTGCATFTICYSATAPQLITPVSTMGQMSSADFQVFEPTGTQVQFSWTPPASTCGAPVGALTYDLEIRKIFDGQSLNDALFNPPAFQRTNIHTTTFLLDLKRYVHVLEQGEKYIVRVKANFRSRPGSPLEVENEGYSQIAGFTYGASVTDQPTAGRTHMTAPLTFDTAAYVTNKITGRVVWSFKKTEDEFAQGGSYEVLIPGNRGPLYSGALAEAMSNNNLFSGVHSGVRPMDYGFGTGFAGGFGPSVPGLGGSPLVGSGGRAGGGIPPAGGVPSAGGLPSRGGLPGGLPPGGSMPGSGGLPGNTSGNLGGGAMGIPAINNLGYNVGRPDQQAHNVAWAAGQNTDVDTREQATATHSFVSSRAATSLAHEHVWTGTDTANQAYPYEGATVILTSRYSNEPIATAIADKDGFFTIEFIHPKYAAAELGDMFEIKVSGATVNSFHKADNNRMVLSKQDLEVSDSIHAGDIHLLADSYRFTGVAALPAVSSGKPLDMGQLVMNVYRRADEIVEKPFLAYEGKQAAAGTSRVEKTFSGKSYVLVASTTSGKVEGDIKSFQFGKLFYGGDLMVEITTPQHVVRDVTTNLNVVRKGMTPKLYVEEVIQVHANYSVPLSNPAIEGRVTLAGGDLQEPVKGAVVQVRFKEGAIPTVADRAGAMDISSHVSLLAPQTTTISPNGFGVRPLTEPEAAGVFSSGYYSAHNPSAMSLPFAQGNVAVPVLVQPNMVVQPAVSAGAAAVAGSRPSNYSGVPLVSEYVAVTDENGYFYIDNLPPLQDTAAYVLELVSTPQNFSNLTVTPESKTFDVHIAKGEVAFREFQIDAEVVPVVGRAVDEDGKPLSFARMHFQGSTSFFETGKDGAFLTSTYPGTHRLVIEKKGHVTREGEVVVTKESVTIKPELVPGEKTVKMNSKKGGGYYGMGNHSAFVDALEGTNTMQLVTGGHGLLPQMVGASVNTSAGSSGGASQFSPILQELFGSEDTYAKDIVDVGDIGFLQKKIARVRFIVHDKEDPAKRLSNVEIALFDTLHHTNASGEWYYEGLGGDAVITLRPEKGAQYAASQRSIELPTDNEVSEVILELEKGVKLYGVVTSSNQPVDSVTISIDGKDWMTTTTDAQGQYEMYLPKGDHDIRVAKVGYMVHQDNRQLASTDVKADYQLRDGGGRNISTLLGFNIELEDMKEGSDNQATWTGRFVGLQPYLTVFSADPLSLNFTNLKVTFDEDGNARPENDQVVTDASSLSMKLFKYIPLRFQNNDQPIVVRKNSKGWGSISGQVVLDVTSILGSLGEWGVAIDEFFPQLVLTGEGHATPGSMEFFLGEGATGAPGIGSENEAAIRGMIESAASNIDLGEAGVHIDEGIRNAKALVAKVNRYVVDADKLEFRFAPIGTEPVKMGLYGFELGVDLANSTVSPRGLSIAGNVVTPDLGAFKTMELPLKEFLINPTFEIGEIEVDAADLPELKIGNWKASMTQFLFSENGLKLGGEVSVNLPGSGTSTLTYKNLRLTPDGVYGGEFGIASDGINIFNAAYLKDNGSRIGFGQKGNSGIYHIYGGVNVEFKEIFKKPISIDQFDVATDGSFDVAIPANYKYDFGFAKFEVDQIRTAFPQNKMPFMEVNGLFSVDLVSFLDFQAGSIRFQSTSNGFKTELGDISAKLSVPVIDVDLGLDLDLQNLGFGGRGDFTIPMTDIGAGLGFRYFTKNGVDLGADFALGATIPIGAVSINSLSGGFNYISAGNTKKIKVTIGGGLSVTGLEQAIAVTDIALSVEAANNAGPIIIGEGRVKAMDQLELGRLYMEMNWPQSMFLFTVESKIEPLPGLVKVDLDGLLKLSWKNDGANKPYFFFGANTNVSFGAGPLGLNAGGQYVIAANIFNPKGGDPSIATFFRNIDPAFIGASNKFSGLYAYAGMSKSASGIGFEIPAVASLDLGYDFNAATNMIFNVADGIRNGKYLLGLNGRVSGYAKANLLWVFDVGAKGCACFAISGGRNDNLGWFVDGRAGLSVAGYAGYQAASLPCDAIRWKLGFIPIGGKICADVHAAIKFSQRDGFNLSGGRGGGGTTNCNCTQ